MTTSGSAVITSASAAFVAGDAGRVIRGQTIGIPAGTTILSIQSGTQATMSANATASTTGNVFVLDANMRSALLVRADSSTKAYTITAPTCWVYWDPGTRTDFIYEATDAGTGAAAWVSGTTYALGNNAARGAVVYVCMLANGATNTIAPENDTAHWQQLHPSMSLGSNDGIVIAPRTANALGVAWAGGAQNVAASALIIASKPSDQVLTSNSTTLQNDNDLTLVMSGNGTDLWFVEYYLIVNTANATMDIKVALSVGSTGATGTLYGLNSASVTFPTLGPQAPAGVPLQPSGLTTAIPFGTAAGTFGLSVAAAITDGGTGGSVRLQAAQNVSDAGAITLKKGSFMRATKLN